jgi:hypothetical protein
VSSFVSNRNQRVRIYGKYYSLGVATAPGANATCVVTKPDGTGFTGSPFAVTDDGGGQVHVDIVMPASDYGIWWAEFTPGASVAADGEIWWTHSPPLG